MSSVDLVERLNARLRDQESGPPTITYPEIAEAAATIKRLEQENAILRFNKRVDEADELRATIERLTALNEALRLELKAERALAALNKEGEEK